MSAPSSSCSLTESPFSLGTRRSLRLLGSPARIRESSGLSMTYDPSDYLDVVVQPVNLPLRPERKVSGSRFDPDLR